MIHLKGILLLSIFVVLSTFFVLGAHPMVPAVIPGQFYRARSFSGLYTVTLQLPQLTPTQRSQYQTWTVQWRRVGTRRWNSRRLSTSTSSTVLNSLQPGSYEVRFQANGLVGTSPFSVPYYFDIPRLPEQGKWQCIHV